MPVIANSIPIEASPSPPTESPSLRVTVSPSPRVIDRGPRPGKGCAPPPPPRKRNPLLILAVSRRILTVLTGIKEQKAGFGGRRMRNHVYTEARIHTSRTPSRYRAIRTHPHGCAEARVRAGRGLEATAFAIAAAGLRGSTNKVPGSQTSAHHINPGRPAWQGKNSQIVSARIAFTSLARRTP